MAIVINSTETEMGILFTIISGVEPSIITAYEWYLNNNLVGTEQTYTLENPITGDEVHVKVKNYAAEHCPIYWHDGQFYGGEFYGEFGGGTFYYGYLNGSQYVFQSPKQKPFIKVSK